MVEITNNWKQLLSARKAQSEELKELLKEIDEMITEGENCDGS